jgi:hypothetical protein
MTSDRYFAARDEITTILYAHGCENISFTPVNDVREVVLTFSHSESNFRFGAKPHDPTNSARSAHGKNRRDQTWHPIV